MVANSGRNIRLEFSITDGVNDEIDPAVLLDKIQITNVSVVPEPACDVLSVG